MTDWETATEILKSQSTLVLATVSEDGLPWATPLFYLMHNGLALYWVSSASSLHSRSLANTADVAATVYSPTDRWKEIRGIQMRGTVHIVETAQERKQVLAAYAERFHLGRIFRVALSQSDLYKFSPSWLRLLDNSKRFGYKRELALPPQEKEPKGQVVSGP